MKSSKVLGKRQPKNSELSAAAEEKAFAEVVEMIQAARRHALSAVNTALVDLYWQLGEYISRKLETATWGEGVVDALALYIQRRQPNLRGFTRRNLFRMRQFFEAYKGLEKVSALLTQLPWTHNLLILGKCKREEEREFYLRMACVQKWSSRELERQINTALFERVVLSPAKLSAPLRELRPEAAAVFKDAYLVEFLDLPPTHSEADLQQALVEQLKQFLIELGRDFCYVGSRYPIQVGGRDFALDLLFFNRALNCLVAFELKIVEFEPEHLGKLQFYLEALDRDVKKPHEQPSIGVLLCATKNNEVVEYALSRSMSPALVSEYQTRLPDKKLLQAKLHEFYALAQSQAESDAQLTKGRDSRQPRTPRRSIALRSPPSEGGARGGGSDSPPRAVDLHASNAQIPTTPGASGGRQGSHPRAVDPPGSKAQNPATPAVPLFAAANPRKARKKS